MIGAQEPQTTDGPPATARTAESGIGLRLAAASCHWIAVRGWFAGVIDPLLKNRVPDQDLRVERYGCLLDLDLRDYVQRRIYCWSQADAELRLVQRWCRPGDVVVDVGANVGIFTLVAGRAVGPAGTVLAIEPMPVTARRLEANLELNALDQVRVHPIAVGSEKGMVRLGSVGAGGDSGSVTVGGDVGAVSVQVTTLDELLGTDDLAGRRVRLLKIDVEGFEERVLRGAKRLLSGPQAAEMIIIEFNESALARQGCSGMELSELLTGHGYRLMRRRPGGRLVPFTPLSGESLRRGRMVIESRRTSLLHTPRRLLWSAALLTDVIAIHPDARFVRSSDTARRQPRARRPRAWLPSE